MPKRTSKARDLNELAKSIVDAATGEVPHPAPEPPPEKNPAAVALGRLGGKKGGPARAQRLTPEERREAAKKAAQARWHGSGDESPER
jgi:hypothetical protein